MALDRARMLHRGRWRPARGGQFPDHGRRSREAPRPSRTGSSRRDARPHEGLDRRPQREGARAAASGDRWGCTTRRLRDGEQTVGVVLSPERQAADRPERCRRPASTGSRPASRASPPTTGRAIELILEAGLDAEIWGFSRAVRSGRRGAGRARPAGVGDREPGLGRRSSRRSVCRGETHARADPRRPSRLRPRAGSASRIFGVDSSARRRGVHPREAYESVGGGRSAPEVVVVDTLGIATPEAAALPGRRGRASASATEVPVHWHGHDDFGLATAAAVAAVQAGATWVQGTVNGMGERAGQRGSRRGRPCARGALRHPDAAPTTIASASSSRALVQELSGDAARGVEARDRRDNLFTRESGCGGGAVPRSRRRSSRTPSERRRRRRGASCSGRRAGSTRSGSRSAELEPGRPGGATSPALSGGGQGGRGRRSAGSSPCRVHAS